MEAAATKVGDEIVTGVVAQIKQQFNYLSQYHYNIENLSEKLKKLEGRREDVQGEVNTAINNSQIFKDGVNNWLAQVEVIKAAAEGILKEEDKVGNGCCKGWCLRLKSRHSLSRRAVKEASKLDVLLIEGDHFTTVAKPQLPLGIVNVPAHSSEIQQANQAVEIQGDEKSENSVSCNATQLVPERIESSSAGTRGGLESRLSILRDVMEAVKDNQIRIVRICGMGGVGKTTMAKEVEKIARDQFLFHEIAMVEFNQEPDLKRVQLHIAEQLGLELKEDDVKARAARLHDRLNGKRQNDGGENKRILVILDNVWRREDLEETGIPLGDEQRCKILLTSRQDDVCKNMAPEKEFKIEVLSDPEARILFRQSLGNSPCYNQIAEELVKACAGLPIAIKTIARAVSNQSEIAWTVALRKLQKCALQRAYDAVFNCLKVSYDFLKNEEIKKFFRLCCLFRKGSEVPIEDLARYGIALRLFEDTDKLYEARDEAHWNVETLLNSNLFLSSDQKGCVKMHDQVWDFAVSTSSTGLFMVNYGDGLKEWPRRDSYEEYTSISLLCSEMDGVLEGRNCRNLELLQLTGDWGNLSLKFQEDFFEGMVGLNVVAFRSMNVPLTPKSLQLLTTLRTLSLHGCSLGDDISMIGNLGKLEVLSFAYSNIKELPTELGKLRRLRLLDLTRCQELHIIAPSVLSSLISLEELYMRGAPLCRGDKVQATFTEIASLSKLVVIDIEIPLEVLPMNSLFEKLEKFKISINKYEGSKYKYLFTFNKYEGSEYKNLFPNILDLICDWSVLLQDGIKFVVQETERMYLNVRGLKTLLDWDFSNLKSLSPVSCNELVYLINSVHKIEFRSLKHLSLQDLPNLVGFCKPEMETSVSGHSYASTSDPFFSQKVGLAPQHTISLRRVSSTGDKGSWQKDVKGYQFWTRANDEGSFVIRGIRARIYNLFAWVLGFIGDYRYDFQATVTQGTGFSEAMLKEDFRSLRSKVIPKPKLNYRFADTENPDVWFEPTKGPHPICRFPNLRSLKVTSCSRLRHLSTPSTFGELQHLEVQSCESLQTIVAAEGREEEDSAKEGILLPKLNHLHLNDLPNLSTIVPKGYTLRWSSLKKLEVQNCGGESDLFANTNNIQKGTTDREIALTSLEELKILETNSTELWRNHFPCGFSYKLRAMDMINCDTLLVIFSPHLIPGFHHLETLSVEHCGSLEVLFDLEELTVGGHDLGRMTHVWKKVPKNFERGFHSLTTLHVWSCDGLRYLFSPSIAKCLVKLRTVDIINCEVMEDVVSKRDEEEEGEQKAVDLVFFPRLQELTVSVLPSLVCIGPAAGACSAFDKLSLEAPNAGSTDKSSNPPSSALVGMVWCQLPAWSLHNLTHLKVHGCNKLLYLFPPHMVVRLPVLQSLSIESCKSLIYLLCSSTATSLVQLRDLRIIKCEMMEVIVKDEDEVEEDRMVKLIVFSSLISIVLKTLSNLKGFCLEVLRFEWPLLTSVKIKLCWKMGVFTSGNSNTPILDGVFINSHKHSLEGNLNKTLMSLQQKDNLAFKDKCILTINGFLIAGDHLVGQCPTWSWNSDSDYSVKNDSDLPENRQFLITRNVPCLRSASSKVVVEDKIEGDECGGDDKNIPRPRSYDVSITFDKPNKSPLLWLRGYDDESEMTMPLELVLQDIVEHHPRELVTVEEHPHLYSMEHHVSLYPHLQPNFMKDLYDHRALQGIQPNVENYLQILLVAYASVVPTIKYKC